MHVRVGLEEEGGICQAEGSDAQRVGWDKAKRCCCETPESGKSLWSEPHPNERPEARREDLVGDRPPQHRKREWSPPCNTEQVQSEGRAPGSTYVNHGVLKIRISGDLCLVQKTE